MFYNFCLSLLHSSSLNILTIRLEYLLYSVCDIKPAVIIRTKYYNKFCIGNVITKNYANAAMFLNHYSTYTLNC